MAPENPVPLPRLIGGTVPRDLTPEEIELLREDLRRAIAFLDADQALEDTP